MHGIDCDRIGHLRAATIAGNASRSKEVNAIGFEILRRHPMNADDVGAVAFDDLTGDFLDQPIDADHLALLV